MSKHHRLQAGSLSYLIICIFLLQTSDANAGESSLHFLIQLALEHNLDLKSERLSLSNEETNLAKAKKEEFYPEVGISSVIGERSWKTTRIKDDDGAERTEKTTTKEKPSVELSSSISRPHPFGGKIRLNLKTTQVSKGQDRWDMTLESEEPLSKSARQNLKDPLFDKKLQIDIANLNLLEKIDEIIYSVVNSYCDLQKVDSSLNIKQKELEDLQANLEIARFKLEKGLIPEMDIFQMELQGSSVLTEMESLKKDKKAQVSRFYQLLGTETIGIEPDNSFLDIKGLHTPFPLSRGEYLVNIPQIKIKHIQIELAKRRLKETEARNYPLLVPSFNVKKEGETTEKSVMASIKFSLYDKGIKKEDVKLALNELAKQELELDKLIKDTGIEIATTIDEIKDKERRIGVLEKEIGLAEKIYEIARIRHGRGLIPAKDLLGYQKDVFQKQKAIFEEQINMFLDYVKLLKTRGELYHAYQNIL